MHLVVMGVSGTGKSSVAHTLRDRLGWSFAEGDDFHPPSNLATMSAGIPLTDADRWPWLAAIADWTREEASAGHSTIVTCSALRRAYRERLRQAVTGTLFVHLAGSPDLIAKRLNARSDHFMPASLRPSQLETLEPLQADEPGIVVDVGDDIDTIVAKVIGVLALRPENS